MGTAYSARLRLNRDRVFFGAMALALIAAMLIGFSLTYYAARWTGAPALTPLVHLHGAVFTFWFLFFFAQTSLVAAGRADLHRRLGVAGAVLALLVIVVGVSVAIVAGRAGNTRGAFTPREFLALPLSIMPLFALFVGLGLWKRRQAQAHKRLMLLASIAIVVPALARIRIPLGLPGPVIGMMLSDLFVLAAVVYDRRTRGAVHPVLVWGGLFYLASQPLRLALARSDAWNAVAALLIG